MLTCSGNSRSPAPGSGRNFPPGQIGTGPWGFFAFLCSIEHDHLLGLLSSILARLLPAAHAPRGWPLVPCSWGEGGFFPPRWASKCLWGFFAFLCGIEHSPLPRLLWAILARCLLLLLHEGGPRAPHVGGGSFLDSQGGPQGWPPRVASCPP